MVEKVMTQHSHVPKFGNWENEDNVPYTVYFDKARKGRTGGKMINPNDPQENPDIVSHFGAPAPASPSKTNTELEKPLGRGAAGTTYENRSNREDSDLKQFRDSPAHHGDMSGKPATDSTHQQGGRVGNSGETYKRPVRYSAGSENSFEHSPLHNQAKNSGRGGGDLSSPAWEEKGLYKNSHGTPGRSRMRPTPRVDESPERGAPVPKFGDWDESNPSSADGYTHIFNKVREERSSGGKVPGIASPSPYHPVNKPTNNESVKSCCFPCGRK